LLSFTVLQVARLCTGHKPHTFIRTCPTSLFFVFFLSLVRLDIQHGRRWYVLLYLPKDDTFTLFVTQAGFSSLQCSWPQGYCSPWFSSCVFILCNQQPGSAEYLWTPRRSSCSRTSSAITSTR
jgi:hypothetical protein